jgi:hypothetical protein
MKLNIEWFEDLEVDGVDTKDYPDFCDAYFAAGTWKGTGKEATEEELIALAELYPEHLLEMAMESVR